MKYPVKIFLYILSWLLAWTIFSWIINTGLIAINVYSQGDKGTAITFFIGGIISIAGGYSLFKEVFQDESSTNN